MGGNEGKHFNYTFNSKTFNMEQYILKSALVAEIERLIRKYSLCPTHTDYEKGLKEGRLIGYKDVLFKINTSEMKEVDLEKEISNYLDNHNLNIQDGGRITFNNGDTPNFFCDFRDIAEHFFKLGLKAKGE